MTQTLPGPATPGRPDLRPSDRPTVDELTLVCSLEETNLLLEALGQLPFARVYALIAKLQAQAQAQLTAGEPTERTI